MSTRVSAQCPSCHGTCYWHDTDWVCDDCGDEWPSLRLYATMRVREGDYLIPANDGATLYRVHKYWRRGAKGWEVSTRPYVEYDGEDVDAFLAPEHWSAQSTQHRTKGDAIDSIVW